MDPTKTAKEHYALQFRGASAVRVEDLAQAIYAIRTGRDDRAPAEQVHQLTESYGEFVPVELALEVLARTHPAPVRRQRREHMGTRIAEARKAMELTPSEFASQAKLPRRVLVHIEETGRIRNPIHLERISHMLGVSSDELRSSQVPE